MNIKEAKKRLYGRKTTYEDLATYALMIEDQQLIEEINNLKTTIVNNLYYDPEDGKVLALQTDQPFVYYGVAFKVLMDDKMDVDIKEKLREETFAYYQFVDDHEEALEAAGVTPDPLDTDSEWSFVRRERENAELL